MHTDESFRTAYLKYALFFKKGQAFFLNIFELDFDVKIR